MATQAKQPYGHTSEHRRAFKDKGKARQGKDKDKAREAHRGFGEIGGSTDRGFGCDGVTWGAGSATGANRGAAVAFCVGG